MSKNIIQGVGHFGSHIPQEKIRHALEYAHLNLSIEDMEKIKNIHPLVPTKPEDKEDPGRHLVSIIRQPEYFYYTCKIIFNIELLPFQCVILKELWERPFPMLIASRGAGKSFLLALYACLRALLNQGSKVVIVGAAFRQSKVIFEYIENIWKSSPIFQDILGTGAPGPKHDVDRHYFQVGDSMILAIPLGDGTKIRGLRATHILSDEFASIPQEIFENVVAGFAAVSKNPVEGVKLEAKKAMLENFGLYSAAESVDDIKQGRGNQSVLSGTAYYAFNHFADYWRRYKAIILSKGNKDRLMEIFEGEAPDNFNWRDYSIIRIPVDILPKGFMEERHVVRSKATVHSGIFEMEFGAIFTTDSAGFFKRAVIEKCTTHPDRPHVFQYSGEVWFEATLQGDQSKQYIYGVDPASEVDNFSIVIIELNPDHRKIVYCWTTTRNKHKEMVSNNYTSDKDFYVYCARKIRELMRYFPCRRIMMDKQGGGIGVAECLHDPERLDKAKNEQLIWEVIDDDKPKDTDDMEGLHILEFCNFSKHEWVSAANDGLRFDLESQICLFPYFDPLSVEFAIEQDKMSGRMYDTLEDCVWEIEELKDELTTITISQTPTGKDKWDTPEVKLPGGKKGRLRKDRYSALLMANKGARDIANALPEPKYDFTGRFVGAQDRYKGRKKDEKPYKAPSWFLESLPSEYKIVSHRR